MATNINIFYPIEDASPTTQINFTQSNTIVFKISQLVESLFNKIRQMSVKPLGDPAYLFVNQHDMVAKKILKVSSWLLGISPLILLGGYIYDRLLDLYHEHFENYSRMEEYYDEISKSLESPARLPRDASANIVYFPEYTVPKIQEPRISINPDNADEGISDSAAETDINSDIGESEAQVVFEEKIASDISNISSQTILEKEPSYINFEISSPIIVSHKDTRISTTTSSIDTIKKDIPRIKYVVNGKQCLSIRDFANQLGLTLNEEETDVLPTNNPIIPRLLHFAHQGLFCEVATAFTKHVMEQDSNKMAAQSRSRRDVEDLTVSIHIDWDPTSLDKPKIIGNVSYHIISLTDMACLPGVYMLQTKCSLDQEEISWKNIGELPPKKPDTNSSARAMEKAGKAKAEEKKECDTQLNVNFRKQGAGESIHLSDNISNTPTDSLKASFEKMDIRSESLEERKHFPKTSSPLSEVSNRIREIAKRVKAFLSYNPFASKKPNVTNAIPSKLEYKEPSYEDLQMLQPIIAVYENPEILTTAENIAQIKVDLPRMEIFVNGIRCSTIQEYINRLGLTLNENETDVLEKDNPIAAKILNLVQQRSLNFSHNVLGKHWQHLNIFPTMAAIENKLPIVRVKYNAEFPERCEITGETFFNLLAMNKDGSGRGFLPYICKVETRHSLDTVEVSWKLIVKPSKKPSSEIAATSVPLQEIVRPEEEFEELEAPFTSISNINYNWEIAFNHLLNQPDSCLNSTVTSEYLKSLKTKYNPFVYEDRLMFPGSITTEEIITSLNKLKNNHPNAQILFLPFLVKGWTVDHAVVAVINLADETIEYFDPKGQSSIGTERTEKQTNKNVFDFLVELGQKIISPTFSREKIIYNKKNVPQGLSDNINCGAYCLQFIEERITRPFKEIENNLAIDPKELRRQLAHRLVENTYSNSI